MLRLPSILSINMKLLNNSSNLKKNNSQKIGFSLIELLVVIGIIAIISAFSYQTYQAQQLTAHRTDAYAVLNHANAIITEYLVLRNKVDLTEDDLAKINLPTQSKAGRYSVSIDTSGFGYKITATAIGQQTDDTECASLSVDQDGNRSAKDHNDINASGCW